MNFEFSKEQEELYAAVSAFASQQLRCDDMAKRDASGAFAMSHWHACAAFGIQGLAAPKEYGGSGFDIVAACAAMEALGYRCEDRGLLFSIHAHIWSVQSPLTAFGTKTQKERYLPKLVSGEWIGAHAMTEPEAGSDAFSLRTQAVLKGDRYILSGAKVFSTNAPHCDLIVAFATTNRDRGMWGLTAFVIERATPGVAISMPMAKMGLRTSPLGEIVFDRCEVPVENRLGAEGQGSAIFNHSMSAERACILASDVGAMKRQLEACIDYARTRRQFGRPIGDFQLVAAKIADMKVRHETARLLLYRAATALASDAKDAAMLGAMAKIYISESSVQSALAAIQIHGANGYMSEIGIERDLRDVVGGQLYSGTSEIQRLLVARHLGLSPKN